MPRVYNDPTRNRVNAGLIGKLPLLIAIAAFSAPRAHLIDVLTNCIRPSEWRPHAFPSGRNEEYRGMVVSICYDLSNPEGSTKGSLEALENGDLGPFYA